jgi:hypothetical protein
MPPITTPDQFTFNDVFGCHPKYVYTSNEITVAGTDTPADISITGGTYSVNGGDFTSDPGTGTINSGDKIRVQGTADYAWGTAVDVVLTIDIISDTFTITTAGAPTVSTGPGTGGSPYVISEDSWIW